MNENPISSQGDVAQAMVDMVDDFSEELGASPTLSELLEIIGLSVPSIDALAGVVPPLSLTATLADGRTYRSRALSRVGELNDSLFVDAGHLLTIVGNDLLIAKGSDISANDVAAQLCAAFQSTDLALADVRGGELAKLEAVQPKKAVRSKVGDVVAIPALRGGFHFASIVARNRFGTAVGVWRDVRPIPLLKPSDDPAAGRVVYTDDIAIKNGSWPVIGHSDVALALFPNDPEAYYPPSNIYQDPQLGEFGAAETAGGRLRQVGREEARTVGLLNGTYELGVPSDELPGSLISEAE